MSRKKSRSVKSDVYIERASKRAAQNIRKQKQTMSLYLSDDVNFESFSNNLALHGLKLRDIPGDGNCLFRALGDQLDGSSENHFHHREETVKYMIAHQSDYEPFVEDDVPFTKHVCQLRNPGTYAGNDAIVAFARNHGVNIVIHQLNAPVWTVKGSDQTNCRQLHIAYHNGHHYSSIRKITDNSCGPANVKLASKSDCKEPENKRGSKKPTDSADPELQKMKRISGNTGCKDFNLIRECLVDTGYDENETVGLILWYRDFEEKDATSTVQTHEKDSNVIVNQRTSNNPIWDKDGSGSRIFGPQTNTVSKRSKTPNALPKKLSNKKRHHEARRERANRNTGRRRNTATSDSDESEMVVKNLSMLNI